MTIDRFFTTTLTVRRLTYTGNKAEYGVIGTFVGHLQQAVQQAGVSAANQMTITHTIWCAVGTNVQIGDTLTTAGRSYSVRAVQENVVGNNPHLEIMVERDDIVSA